MAQEIFWLYPHLNYWMGGTRFIADLSKYITQPYTVTVGSAGGKADIMKYFADNGVSIKMTGKISTNNLIYWVFSPVLILTELLISLKLTKNSAIIIGTLFPSIFIAAICAKFYKKPFIHLCYVPYPWFHDSEYINQYNPFKKLLFKVLAILYKSLDLWAAKQAQSTITLDPHNAAKIHTVYGIEPEQISMGVDTEFFVPVLSNINPILKKYKGKKIIMHSTDYTKVKNTNEVLMVFKDLIKKIPNTILLITSTRPNTAEETFYKNLAIQLNIHNNVIFLGAVNYHLLPAYYSAAWCYLSLSFHPMVAANLPVKEALSCGTPVVRDNIPFDDVQNNKSGFLINHSNHAQIVNKLIFLLKNKTKNKSMGILGREYITKKYSWPNVSKKFISIVTNTNNQYH